MILPVNEILQASQLIMIMVLSRSQLDQRDVSLCRFSVAAVRGLCVFNQSQQDTTGQ